MNRFVAFWGVVLSASGVTMYLLLQALGEETFFMSAIYIPPSRLTSYGMMAAGGALVISSLVFKGPGYREMSGEAASRHFARLALANAVAAAVFAIPMLLPPLELPILLTEWPGIYIVVSYTFFVIFAVLGMLAWAVAYRFMPVLFSGEYMDRRSVLLQLAMSEVSVYVFASVLFAAGFRGASLVHDGQVGPVFVGASMEFADIPTAVAIFVMIVSVLLGAANIFRAKKAVPELRA